MLVKRDIGPLGRHSTLLSVRNRISLPGRRSISPIFCSRSNPSISMASGISTSRAISCAVQPPSARVNR